MKKIQLNLQSIWDWLWGHKLITNFTSMDLNMKLIGIDKPELTGKFTL